jgi:predicted molibdopterin-dependent oxidoreductase YjgC
VDTLVLLDTHRSHLESLAHVVIPVRVAAEKDGTLTNHAGRVQRVRPVVEPAFEARAEGEVLWSLAQALGLPGFEEPYDVRAMSKALAQAVPAFAGLDLDSVPAEGAPLAGST